MNTIWKVGGLLLLIVIFAIIYSMITETLETVETYETYETFVEGNDYNDCEEKVKQKVQQALNTPIAKVSGDNRATPDEILNKIKEIRADVENGTGDFEGNTIKCFPVYLKMNMELPIDTNVILQKMQSMLN
jgi:hypothetical protein